MRLNNSTIDWLRIIKILAISVFAIIIIKEQFFFLKTFYSKYPAHWIVTVLLFIVSIRLGYRHIKMADWRYYLTSVLLLTALLFQLELLLKLHEYSHLSYLLGYILIGVTGSYCGSLSKKNKVRQDYAVVIPLLFFMLMWSVNDSPFIAENQRNYSDRVIYVTKTDHHQVDVTAWRGNHWFYYDGKVQFSTVDHWLYSEPMAHPAMKFAKNKSKLLLIGGENGLLLKELLKYDSIHQIDIALTDSKLFELAMENSYFKKLIGNSLMNDKVKPIDGDLIQFLKRNQVAYDAVFIDIPDPTNTQWNDFYTSEFYKTCYNVLSGQGVLVTQAGSPYFATMAFMSIEKTLQSANFHTLPIHNQVLTLGEWGWILASKSLTSSEIKSKLMSSEELKVPTQWLNKEAMQMLVSFGKPLITQDSIRINTSDNPVLIDYYQNGNYRFK